MGHSLRFCTDLLRMPQDAVVLVSSWRGVYSCHHPREWAVVREGSLLLLLLFRSFYSLPSVHVALLSHT